MSDDDPLFTPHAIAAIERRYAVVPPFARPLLWEHGTQPQHGQLRAWLREELARLDDGTRGGFISRLLDAARYTGALAELATGHVLRQPGYRVASGVKLSGLTPDILVTDPSGRQLVVEVWRRGLPSDAIAANSRWMELARHLRRVRVPVRLGLDSLGPGVTEAPDAPARRAIERAVRDWITSGSAHTTRFLDVEGLRFWIAGPATEGRAELAPVRTGTAANRDLVLTAVEQKVKRYRRLVDELNVPLMVVLSADRETGLDCSHVASILAGKNSISMSIPVFGVGAIETGPVTLLQNEVAPRFDEALSAVAWLDVRDGVHAELDGLWPCADAKRPIGRLDERIGAG